ncbi:sigma factor [Streptomyces sp. NPDC086033]|uniref:sigma factor n=1 Tax=Streptomyces sp. NPDC086033 TaxID=3365747 RepID=UPI0037D551CE
MADAEHVTQDVWLRAAGADLRDIGDLRAWLVTVAARRSYDILKSARFRRETLCRTLARGTPADGAGRVAAGIRRRIGHFSHAPDHGGAAPTGKGGLRPA